MHYNTNNSEGCMAKHVAPQRSRNSRSRNPQSTLMQGSPALRAVRISTSLSPTYTAPTLSAPIRRQASLPVSGAGFFRTPAASFSPMATQMVSAKK